MRDKLREYEAESEKIKKALNKYFGMTISEARSAGWGKREDELQARLWSLGYKIACLRNAIRQEEGKEAIRNERNE